MGVVFQDPDDQLFMPSVRDDVAFGPANLGLRGAALEAQVVAALDRVGMLDYIDRPPTTSPSDSDAEWQWPPSSRWSQVLVLDEPSSNLDPASRRELADILRSLDVTVLMVTHDLPYAYELCPRSVVLSDGVIVADGPTQEVLTDDSLMAAHRLEYCPSASTPAPSRHPDAFFAGRPGEPLRLVGTPAAAHPGEALWPVIDPERGTGLHDPPAVGVRLDEPGRGILEGAGIAVEGVGAQQPVGGPCQVGAHPVPPISERCRSAARTPAASR